MKKRMHFHGVFGLVLSALSMTIVAGPCQAEALPTLMAAAPGSAEAYGQLTGYLLVCVAGLVFILRWYWKKSKDRSR